jgi:hypothetical protein
MQIRRPDIRIPARRAAKYLVEAPLIATLALASTVITAVVALGTVNEGRLPANGSIGMVCALMLAAVAVVEASRAARLERVSRRISRPRDSSGDVSGVDVPTAYRWR